MPKVLKAYMCYKKDVINIVIKCVQNRQTQHCHIKRGFCIFGFWVCFFFLMVAAPMEVRCCRIVVLILISLMMNYIKHLFVLVGCLFSLEKCLFHTLAQFLIGLLGFSVVEL